MVKQLQKSHLWDVEKYKKERREQGRKPEAINREIGVLKRMFNLGIRWGITASNPVKGIKRMEAGEGFYRTLSDEEFGRLYHSASLRIKPILLYAYLTGMRRGEIRNLKTYG